MGGENIGMSGFLYLRVAKWRVIHTDNIEMLTNR